MAITSVNLTETTPANNDDVTQLIQPETDNIFTFMDSQLYWDASKGKIDTFKEDEDLQLEQILTPTKNSVLHVYITSSEYDETNFVEEILRICPALLLQPNENGDVPLHVAARNGHERIVKYLLDCAKGLDEGNNDDLESGRASSSTSIGVTQEMLRKTNKENSTSLHEAVRFRHLGVVRILTMEDPDYLYAANGAGETPLYMAAERGYRDLVTEILDNCSSVAAGGPNDRTALHAATIAKDIEVTTKLLRKMVHLTKEADDKGWVPLHYAADLNYLQIVKRLLHYDKYVAYIRDKEGRTPLHIAASHGYSKIMKHIMQLCPDCSELVDNRGWNVLHYAVESDGLLAVNEIINASPLSNYLLNGKDKEGNTPFHFIQSSWIAEIFLALPGLDKMAFNIQNQNALDMASTITKRVYGVNQLKICLRKRGLRRGRRKISSPNHEEGEKSNQENKKNNLNGSTKERAREPSLIVATLIATVTFTAGFTLPGGYVSDNGPLQGTAVLRKNRAFQAFVITNMIAFVLSSNAVLCHLSMALMSNNNKQRAALDSERAVGLILWAIAAMVIALVTAMFAVLEPSLALAIVACIISLLFFENFIRIFKFNRERIMKFGSTF